MKNNPTNQAMNTDTEIIWEEVERKALQLAAVQSASRGGMDIHPDSEPSCRLQLAEAAKAWLEACGWTKPETKP